MGDLKKNNVTDVLAVKEPFINSYSYNACKTKTNIWITNLVKEGSGIRSIARLLKISTTTVLKRILSIAKSIKKPAMALGKIYEVDEIRTFYKSKTRLLWVVYPPAILRMLKII